MSVHKVCVQLTSALKKNGGWGDDVSYITSRMRFRRIGFNTVMIRQTDIPLSITFISLGAALISDGILILLMTKQKIEDHFLVRLDAELKIPTLMYLNVLYLLPKNPVLGTVWNGTLNRQS